jgi:hypothetical protein
MADFTQEDIAVMLESIKYSKQRVVDAPDTPYLVRQEKLGQLEDCEKKLRHLRDES